MPDRNTITKEINENAGHDIVRRRYLSELSEYTKRDTVVYATAAFSLKSSHLPPQATMLLQEDMNAFMSALYGLTGTKLDLVLHSPGGSPETAEQIINYLRSKYNHIRAIIPQNAMSAATMLACACDEIVMAKHSALGPIDPQISFPTATGRFTAPAQAILDEFEEAKKSVIENPKSAVLWLPKINSYPHGFLNMCQMAIQSSGEQVGKWLQMYMFKNNMDEPTKAEEIAKWLSDANKHKSHGKPISIDDAKNHGLIVTKLEDDQTLQDKVLSLFHAICLTFDSTQCTKIVENQNGKGSYTRVGVNQIQ